MADEINLSAPRRRFIENYVANGFNATKAYTATYKTKNRNAAKVSASKLLTIPNVRKFLNYRLETLMTDEGIENQQRRVLRELEFLAFSNVTDIVSWDGGGNLSVTASDALPDDVRAAIKKFKATANQIEIEMHTKLSALDTLAKIHGMMADRKEITGKVGGPITLAQAISEIEDANTGPGGV